MLQWVVLVCYNNLYVQKGVQTLSASIQVSMLGQFRISMGDAFIDDHSNRMKKVWLLLAYMIYARDRRHTQEQYLSLLQGSDSSEAEDPAGRLKALLYRARSQLNGLAENAGHQLIVHKNGFYCWNTEIPLTLDVEEFDGLCTQASREQDPQKKLQLQLQALSLYEGDFLPKLSIEPWVMPIHTYYHRKFLETVEEVLPVLEDANRWGEAEQLAQKALKMEPYSEILYRHQMQCLLQSGQRASVISVYEQMSELLFETFGVMPSEESRQLYRQASLEKNDQSVPIDTVREQLRENTGSRGAMYCEYDFFKLLYQVQARALIRSGDVIHIALLSLRGMCQQELSRRSLDIAMDNLQSLVLDNLRQGDVVTRCSVSQLIVMLPQANFENSCAVCKRIIKAFRRQYPHSPADIHFSVQPLEPASSEFRPVL